MQEAKAGISQEAMQICGVTDVSKHWFVDDSLLNVRGAKRQGWSSWLFDEDNTYDGKVKEGEINGTVSSLQGKCLLRIVPYMHQLTIYALQIYAKHGSSILESNRQIYAGRLAAWSVRKVNLAILQLDAPFAPTKHD